MLDFFFHLSKKLRKTKEYYKKDQQEHYYEEPQPYNPPNKQGLKQQFSEISLHGKINTQVFFLKK